MRLKFQKGDTVAIGAVVLLAVAVLLAFLPEKNRSGGTVEIYQGGTLVATLPLEKNGSYTAVGAYSNVITVENGQVCISASDCPGQDCVHGGSISAVGRSIVCLPNGVEVRIVEKSGDVDFVVG